MIGEQSAVVAGRYRLGVRLGRGGMGEVYRATDELLGRSVAIKVMLPVADTLAAEERFRREARAAAKIADPHVVTSYDFGEYGDGFYLAMELVEGPTVGEAVREYGPFTPARAVDLVRQAARGLAAAHRCGVVHRDIKPGNLLLSADGTLKITDFGIVRLLDDSTTTLTATGQIVGSSHYLAPERIAGRPALPASDIYALGCVLYQLLTGHPPFTGDDPAAVMYQHLQAEAPRPTELLPAIPPDVEALLFWMLEKDPSNRPTAQQVAAGATPPPVVDRTADTVVQSKPTRARVSRRQILAASGATIAVVLAATAGVLLDRTGVPRPRTDDLPASTSSTVPSSPRSTATARTTPVAKPTSRPATSDASTSAPVRTTPRGPSTKPQPPQKSPGKDHHKTPKPHPHKKP
ncbi:serine/threonine-protein kinase [Kribbella sp. NPDC049584]|uniref:serine/threonine-protein kinase n=1 Tax=Kribbella sp. NPDC049584 TaxID=3154833 RepID=UPI003447B80C